MKWICLSLVIFISSNIVAQYDNVSADTVVEVLSKHFLEYDKNYTFKGIKFETPFATVSKIAKLKNSNISDYFTIGNPYFLTYNEFTFENAGMSFHKGKLIDVLLSKEYNLKEYYTILRTFKQLFGTGIGEGNEYFWKGKNLYVAIERDAKKIYLFISSVQLKPSKLINM